MKFKSMSKIKEGRAAYYKARNERPEIKEAIKKWNARPEVRAAQKAWQTSPEGKASQKAWYASKKGKESSKISSLRTRCKQACTTVEYYNLLPKRRTFPGCTAIEPGGRGDWHLDHGHTTNKFRGLLCARHNRKVGDLTLEDVADVKEYLIRHLSTNLL